MNHQAFSEDWNAAMGELLRAFEPPHSSKIPHPRDVIRQVLALKADLTTLRAQLQALQLEWRGMADLNERAGGRDAHCSAHGYMVTYRGCAADLDALLGPEQAKG